MELKEAVTEFFYSRDITPTSRDWYGYKLRAFVSWCETQGVTNVDEIATKLVRQFLTHQRETPTIHHRQRSSHTAHGDARAVERQLDLPVGLIVAQHCCQFTAIRHCYQETGAVVPGSRLHVRFGIACS